LESGLGNREKNGGIRTEKNEDDNFTVKRMVVVQGPFDLTDTKTN
jgi:hypothetical protein